MHSLQFAKQKKPNMIKKKKPLRCLHSPKTRVLDNSKTHRSTVGSSLPSITGVGSSICSDTGISLSLSQIMFEIISLFCNIAASSFGYVNEKSKHKRN